MVLLANTIIGCILALLPGPPEIKIENATFYPYPVSKVNFKCPEINPKTDILFYLYTGQLENEPQLLLLNDEESLQNSNFDINGPTVLYFHGFLESTRALSSEAIKRAYTKKGDCNLIIVDSKRLYGGPWYVSAAGNSYVVGKYTAEFIDFLVSKGVSLQNIHLIGHSLGAHAAGVTGSYIKSGKVSRITGLDPAQPLFEIVPNQLKLDKSDAKFVDIIHTDIGVFGAGFVTGHADFYPNGGEYPQPNCRLLEAAARTKKIIETIFCSHLKSVYYYAQTVLEPDVFPAVSCLSWSNFQSGQCAGNEVVKMGLEVPSTASGKYFLTIPYR